MATDYEISSDGRTVWINGVDSMLGRFGPYGIDVHVAGECTNASCIPGLTDSSSWVRFKELMLSIHNIAVPDRYKPKASDRRYLCPSKSHI